LVYQYEKTDQQEEIYKIYLSNTKYINNWDLVDTSTPNIVGSFLVNNDRKVLYNLAESDSLWERRISILATFKFIRNGQFKDTLLISETLLNDDEDLIHKAVGWMLREVGNRDIKTEEKFLKKHYNNMPRTMLRYAIEKFEEEKRQKYLKGKI
jgi:3-methyladenine DNA glycosylase AlkD